LRRAPRPAINLTAIRADEVAQGGLEGPFARARVSSVRELPAWASLEFEPAPPTEGIELHNRKSTFKARGAKEDDRRRSSQTGGNAHFRCLTRSPNGAS
jgi:hypothetical protein